MPKGRVLIDDERCKECSLCVNACPFGVLRISERINTRVSGAVYRVQAVRHYVPGCCNYGGAGIIGGMGEEMIAWRKS